MWVHILKRDIRCYTRTRKNGEMGQRIISIFPLFQFFRPATSKNIREKKRVKRENKERKGRKINFFSKTNFNCMTEKEERAMTNFGAKKPGGDPMLSDVAEKNILEYETIELDERWVSDGLCKEVAQWDYNNSWTLGPILINAPTGSGKGTFVMRDLADRVKQAGKNVLLISNRSALELQQKHRMAQNFGSNLSSEALSKIRKLENVYIVTYQGLLSPGALNGINPSSVGAVVLDEAHFFCADALFNPYTSETMHTILRRFWGCQRIYMSATADAVKDLIAHEEWKLQQDMRSGNMPNIAGNEHLPNLAWMRSHSKDYSVERIKEFRFKEDYSFVNLTIVRSWEDVSNMIRKDESNGKWLVFIRNKKDGKTLKDAINKTVKYEYIDAQTKVNNKMYFQDLVRRERFEAKVLIATSALDNGVNFWDQDLKHVVIDSTDPVEAKQMLGRKRVYQGEEVAVYLMHKTRKQIDEERKQLTDEYRKLDEYWDNPQAFFQKYWGNLTESEQKMFAPSNNGFLVNRYARYQLNSRLKILEDLSDEFSKGDEYAFERAVCGWFGKQFSTDTVNGKLPEEQTKEELLKIYERYSAESPLDEEKFKKLLEEIKTVTCEYDQKTIGLRNGESRELASINNVAKHFGLPYQGVKRNNQWVISKK